MRELARPRSARREVGSRRGASAITSLAKSNATATLSHPRKPASSPRSKTTVRVVLADSYPLILEGLEHLFAPEPDIKVVESCTTGDQALAAVRTYRPDILIVDLRIPEHGALEVVRTMRQENHATRVVVLAAGSLSEDETLDAMRAGVKGIVMKEMSPRLLVQCVRKVYAGGTWLEKSSVGRAIDKLLRREAGGREVAKVLTRREIEIARIVAVGLRNRDIAAKLGISEGTVKMHLHNVYEKLDVRGRLALTLYARDKGLV
jgi:two-component system, NarL family, nitrate/nitrite response regulator NarL